MKRIASAIALLSIISAAFAGVPARAAFILAASVSGTGSFNNSTALIIDGVLPPRATFYAASTNVYWSGIAPTFTIDLGGLYTVQSLTVDVDNNDTYLVQSSVDGTNYTNLFTFLFTDGPVVPVPGGMEILTTDPAFPTSPGNLTTPAFVGRGFAPVNARYLRISAVLGDDFYSIGEVQAFGVNAVPEPSSLALCGLALAGASAARAARRK